MFRPRLLPVRHHFRISSPFGPRDLNGDGVVEQHKGIDLACKVGTPIIAPVAGKVVRVDNGHQYNGNAVFLRMSKDPRFQDDGSEYTAVFVHLEKVRVEVGDEVIRGAELGTTGNTGKSTGPHLHFELWRDGVPVNPADAYKVVSITERDPDTGKFTSRSVLAVHPDYIDPDPCIRHAAGRRA